MENRDEVIRHLTEHRRELQAERDQLVRGIDAEIEHVSATIASLEKLRSESPSTLSFNVARLRGLTQVPAIVAIANSNDGIVKAQDAKRLLIRAGIMRQTKNSNSAIHSVIKRSGRFERVRSGVYRLKAINGKSVQSEVQKLIQRELMQ